MTYEELCDFDYHHCYVETPEMEEKRIFIESLTELFKDLESILVSNDELSINGIEYILDEMSELLKCKRSNQPVFLSRPKINVANVA